MELTVHSGSALFSPRITFPTNDFAIYWGNVVLPGICCPGNTPLPHTSWDRCLSQNSGQGDVSQIYTSICEMCPWCGTLHFLATGYNDFYLCRVGTSCQKFTPYTQTSFYDNRSSWTVGSIEKLFTSNNSCWDLMNALLRDRVLKGKVKFPYFHVDILVYH